MVIVLWE
uniref:Uncharacterized protein n=1 Tax=Oryza punctata TaxID=4537 RepID=A0A1Y8Z5A0_ORYPU